MLPDSLSIILLLPRKVTTNPTSSTDLPSLPIRTQSLISRDLFHTALAIDLQFLFLSCEANNRSNQTKIFRNFSRKKRKVVGIASKYNYTTGSIDRNLAIAIPGMLLSNFLPSLEMDIRVTDEQKGQVCSRSISSLAPFIIQKKNTMDQTDII